MYQCSQLDFIPAKTRMLPLWVSIGFSKYIYAIACNRNK